MRLTITLVHEGDDERPPEVHVTVGPINSAYRMLPVAAGNYAWEAADGSRLPPELEDAAYYVLESY